MPGRWSRRLGAWFPPRAGILSSSHCEDAPVVMGRGKAVRGYALRAAELAGAVAGLVTAVLALAAGCALLGVAAAGGGGAGVGIVLAAVLVVFVFVSCERMALSAMLAGPVSEVEHPELYRLVREL